jgi:hypothetical protein
MKAIAGVKVRPDQVAQQVHGHLSIQRKSLKNTGIGLWEHATTRVSQEYGHPAATFKLLRTWNLFGHRFSWERRPRRDDCRPNRGWKPPLSNPPFSFGRVAIGVLKKPLPALFSLTFLSIICHCPSSFPARTKPAILSIGVDLQHRRGAAHAAAVVVPNLLE